LGRLTGDSSYGFTYNQVDLNDSYQTPLSGSYQYEFDRDRRLIQTTFPSGRRINNIYDNIRLSQIVTPDYTVNYSYLCGTKVGGITKGGESISYAYDGKLVTSETLSGTLTATLGYTYNNDFRVTGFTYAGGSQTYAYDNDGLLTQSGTFAITRNAQNGLPVSVVGGSLSLSRTFNGYAEISGQNAAISGSSKYSWNVTRDNTGRITGRTDTIAGATAQYGYTYDSMGRQQQVTKDGTLVEEYGYENVPYGTCTYAMNSQRGISGRSLEYDAEDRLLSAGSATYQYNVDGFLAQKTNGADHTFYDYSLRGELQSVTLPDGTVISYVHDPLGRRIAKKVNGATVEKYLWSGMTQLLAVYDGSGSLKMRFEYADDRMPVSMMKDGTRYYLAYDPVGSLRLVTNGSGAVIKQIDYDAFGCKINDTNPLFTVPFGFAGGLYDRDTGLVRFGFRDYDPDTGRWTAKDPIGFAGGDTDLYGYCLNDPVNWVDPSGLYWFRQDWQEPGVVGRRDTIVPPGGSVSEFIEQNVPAGYTFGQMHDAFVDIATSSGLPDWLINIPSMSFIYDKALFVEMLRTLEILEQPSPPEQVTPCK
jgi:RHS repeat-associated protein